MSGSVIVKGFDFNTSDEQIMLHMSSVGAIESIEKVDDGSACVTYSSALAAQAAVKLLQQSSIAGNTRYIDVLLMDPKAFVAGKVIDADKKQQFFAMTPEQQMAIISRGSLSTARDPTAVLVSRMNQARGVGKGSFGPARGMTGGMGNGPYGGGGMGAAVQKLMMKALERSVLVKGFDFGTSDEQIEGHMSNVGTIESFQLVDDGSACVTYSALEEAQAAVAQLQQTSIAGNSRYIEVILMNPEAFVAEHNIDMNKAQQFFAMTADQQLAIMAKGSLASARDPNAVLVQRMNEARKKSAGPAKGRGGGMTGGMGNGLLGGMTGGMTGGMDPAQISKMMKLKKGGGRSSVLVRGFDFQTSQEQIVAHMSSAGNIKDVQQIDDGSVGVTYSSLKAAQLAVAQLQHSKIAGNSRYIDVIPMDPQAFLAEHNIDVDKAQQFFSMNPEQQMAVMAQGPLSAARDPTAVLVRRMSQARGVGKASGGMGNGSLGGMGKGGMGKGGKMAMIMEMMKGFM